MIIKNGEVFQEDGSFRLQDLYVENHRIVASEDEVTDKTIVDAAGQASGKTYLQASFPLRCFQRLSLPHIATRSTPPRRWS